MAFGYRRRSFRPQRTRYPYGYGRTYRDAVRSGARTMRRARRNFPSSSVGRRTVRRGGARSAPAGGEKVTGTRHGDKYILSQADPFDEQVDGVKIPDSNSQPSVPMKAEDTFDFNLNAGETAQCQAFNPSCVATQVYTTTALPTSWSWPAAFGNIGNSAKLAQLRSDQELFRSVAHAVRITSGLAPTAATGFVHVCVFTQALYNQTTWAYPTTIALMQAVPGYKRIPIGRLTAEGLTVVNRPMDTTAQRYVDTDSPIYGNAGVMEFQTGMQWGSIVIAITGCQASTTPISVESILHLECIPRATAISTATPAAKYNPSALGGASNGNSATSPSALDSEKPQRRSSFLSNALRGVAAAGGGKAQSIGMRFSALLNAGRSAASNVNMSGGIRNVVSSSGMLL